MNKEKKRDLIIVTLLFFLGLFLTLKFNLGYTPMIIISAGVASIYISFRRKDLIKKTAIYSLLLSVPVVFIFDYIMHVSGAWFETSSFGIRVLNAFPIDTFIWAFLYSYFIISFYEFFFDRDKNKEKFSRRLNYLVYILAVLSVIFGIVYFLNKDLLVIKYFYGIFLVLFFFIPMIYIFRKYPKLPYKFLIQTFYFFILSIVYELIGLYLGLWNFPGQYIGWVEIVGLKFPLEELLWLIFAVPAQLAVYEFFADDTK